jgi:hypothetical protein
MKPILLASTSLLVLPLTLSPAGASVVTFNYTGSIQTYTTTKAGLYEIDVAGAQGGSCTNIPGGETGGFRGGWGGTMKGEVYLRAGMTFALMVGGRGDFGHFGGGGGGGSFVIFDRLATVLVAGGGGGAGLYHAGGSTAGFYRYSYGGSGTSGVLGAGAEGGVFGYGGAGPYGGGGGGGGVLTDGGGYYGGGGHSYEHGGMGGRSWANLYGVYEGGGGFGGGGGAGFFAGGGGGGLNGGGGGGPGGGGGGAGSDYYMHNWDWLWTDHRSGAHTGDGFIVIKSGADVPEPASLGLAGAGLAGLGAIRRRRRRARQG